MFEGIEMSYSPDGWDGLMSRAERMKRYDIISSIIKARDEAEQQAEEAEHTLLEEMLRRAITLAREEMRRRVKCPICGRKTVVLKETRETSSIGLDVFECEKCGLIFYIP
jgi:DNA-directed RNA polymerase subunit M/transcription elongation factor TFIIS